MQILPKDSMEMERHLFYILNLINFNYFFNVGSEGSVAQTIVKDEGVKGN